MKSMSPDVTSEAAPHPSGQQSTPTYPNKNPTAMECSVRTARKPMKTGASA